MSKLTDDSVMDAALAVVASANDYHICAGDPVDRAGVIANSLANVAPTFTGPVNGDVSGRKLTIDSKSGVSVTATGTAAVACLIDGTTLLDKTDLAATQLITLGNTITIQAWDHEIADPA